MIKSKQDAMRALSDVNPDNNFWACDGSVLKNLDELLNFVKNTQDNVYGYHVNEERNDFSNWIRDIMGDVKLAGDLSKTKAKEESVKILNERVKWLKKKAKI